ncbi:MAG: ATP-binding protein [Blastocatellia bacterium]
MDHLTVVLPGEDFLHRKKNGGHDVLVIGLAALAFVFIAACGFIAQHDEYCLLLYLIPSLLTFGLARRSMIFMVVVLGTVITLLDFYVFSTPADNNKRQVTALFSFTLQILIAYLAFRQWRFLSSEQARRMQSDAQLREISSELEAVGQQQRRLERRNRELAALNEIARVIGRSERLETAFRFAMETIADLTTHEAVFLLGDKDVRLIYANEKLCGYSVPELEDWLARLDREKRLTVPRRQSRSGLHSSTVPAGMKEADVRRADSDFVLALREYGFVSYVILPLNDGERHSGSLILASRINRHVTDEDLSFLNAVANQLGGKIERQRLEGEASRHAEKQLALERRLTRLLTESAPVAIAHLSSSLIYSMTNPIFQDLMRLQTGDPDLDLVGRYIGEVAPQFASGQQWADDIQLLIQKGQPFTVQSQPSVAQASGHTSWWDWTVWPVRDQEGRTESILLMGADVTRRISAERDLETALAAAWTERNKLEAVIEQITDAVFIADAVTRNVSRVNSAGARLLGFESPFQLEKSLDSYSSLLSPRLPDGQPLRHGRFLLNRALQGEVVRNDHLVLRRLDGSLIHVIAGASPVRNASGEIVLAVGILHDVTSLLEIQQELEKSNQSKDLFLAMLSHELRTPLTPILGWSRIIQENAEDPAALQQGLEAIERNARLQSQLVDDLLDMSRIITGKIDLNRSPQDLNQLIRYALETVQTRVDGQMLDVEMNLASGLLPVMGDPTRLEQVIWNLLANAVKFTPVRGRIRITSRRFDGYCQFTVTDDGIGINPESLHTIFDHFQQVDSGTSRRHGGLGIGLAISKSLVEMHGGAIWAESEGEGRGASFHFTLPLFAGRMVYAIPGEKKAGRQSRLPGIKVLVLEDSDDSRELFGMVLRSRGCEVQLARAVPEAVQMLSRLKPDVIISDIGLPDIDGYEFVRRVRQMPGLDRIPVIALSGYATEKDKRRSHEAGFDLHLAKPIEPEQIIGSVQELLSRQSR